MRKKSSKKLPKRLKSWLDRAKSGGSKVLKSGSKKGKSLGGSLRGKMPGRLKGFDFDFQNMELENVSRYSGYIRWALVVLALFFLAQVTAGIIGLFIRPEYPDTARRAKPPTATQSQEDYGEIERRNMFNVEGNIPEPFDQGLLGCFTQAKPSSQRLILHGTIVVNAAQHSTALVQEEGSADKVAVKVNEPFLGKYTALEIARKKLCFQVKSTQELEYIEIPEDAIAVSSGPALETSRPSDGIAVVSENKFEVKRDFLDKNLLNLNEILQTARAVPYVDPATGKFKGFLIQTIDKDSPFSTLGIKRGDILTGVNEIVLDNAGKGLEAFQKLRNSDKVSLKVIRGGRETSLEYDVK